MNTQEPLLQLKNLHKKFKGVYAVKGVSFDLFRGECFGLLGPNGAGKSTTIEMIEQIIAPDEGEILFEGKALNREFAHHIGVQFQSTSLPQSLTVKESLQTFHQLYPERLSLEEIIEKTGLGPFQHQMHSKISGGQKQKLLLAIALCHSPQIIFLDEPTTGLDPKARRELWQIVQELKKQDKTILLTTHYMEEAFELCDRIGIMKEGELIALGPPQKLLNESFKTMIFHLHHSRLEELKFLEPHKMRQLKDGIEILTEDPNALVGELIRMKLDFNFISLRKPNLEDLFLLLAEGKAGV